MGHKTTGIDIIFLTIRRYYVLHTGPLSLIQTDCSETAKVEHLNFSKVFKMFLFSWKIHSLRVDTKSKMRSWFDLAALLLCHKLKNMGLKQIRRYMEALDKSCAPIGLIFCRDLKWA